MEAELTPLLPLLDRERAASRPFALAVVVHTSGSTYRKPGALMAIATDGSYAGLLSGGCLESDLREHARSVIETGRPRTVTYNTGGSDDALWGLGVGCEGAMQILLLRVGPEDDWRPVSHLADALAAHRHTAVGIVVESRRHDLPAGRVLLPGDRPAGSPLDAELGNLLERAARSGHPAWLESAGGIESGGRLDPASKLDSAGVRIFSIPLALPPRLLLLGGGPDVLPIVDLAARLSWTVTVFDHRPAYAQADHFPAAHRVVLARPEELADTLDLGAYEAAVVISHHLPSDLEYLRALSAAPIGYVGLLGPPHRREKLLGDLGDPADGLRTRLHSPVGLHLGGRTPESIALSIVAEVHAYVHEQAERTGP